MFRGNGTEQNGTEQALSKTLTPFADAPTIAEGNPTYALQAPKREQQEAWRVWNR